MDHRIVYAKRNGAWVKIDFEFIRINEDFIICESDGLPVGHFVAASRPWDQNGVGHINTIEI